MTPNQIVSRNLRRARDLRGLTQEDVAEALGISPANYSLIETSWKREDRIRQHTADDLVTYATVFDVPVLFFLLPPVDDGKIVESVETRQGALDGAGYLSKVLPILDVDWLSGSHDPVSARIRELSEILDTDLTRQLDGVVELQAEHSVERAIPDVLELYLALGALRDDVREQTNRLQRVIEDKVIDPAWETAIDELAQIKAKGDET